MPPKNALSVSLSQEEVLAVLAYLEAPSLVGLETEILQGLGDDERRLVLGVAERALIARGFLRPGADNRLELAPEVQATVGACAFPEESVIVTRSPVNAIQEKYFFHCSRRMVVLHVIPMTAIHQFVALEEKQDMLKAMLSILSLADLPAPACPPATLEQETLLAARDAAEKGTEAALALLSPAGLEDVTARELARSLTTLTASTTLVRVAQKEAAGFTLLQAENGAWVLSPQNGEGENHRVLAVPASPDEVRQRVRTLLGL